MQVSGFRKLIVALAIVSVSINGTFAPEHALGAVQEDESSQEYAARLYEGNCQSVEMTSLDDFSSATPEAGAVGEQVSYSLVATVDVPLSTMVSSPHAIAVDLQLGGVAETIACGDITGPAESQRLVLGLNSVETGELIGVAVVRAGDQAETSIAVFLVLGDSRPIQEDIADGQDRQDQDGQDVNGQDPDDGDSEMPEGGV